MNRSIVVAVLSWLAFACGTSGGPGIEQDLENRTDVQIAGDASDSTVADSRSGDLDVSEGGHDEFSPSDLTACQNSLDCPGQLVCDASTSMCVECVTSAECEGSETCGVDGNCHPPAADCDSDKDCKDDGKLCDLSRNKCVECLDDTACEESEYCIEGLCLPDECLAGESQCSGLKVLQCADNGSGFVEKSICNQGQYCADGKCHDYACQSGQSWCDGSLLKTCSQDGRTIAETVDCAEQQQHCFQGECLDTVCQPMTKFCVDESTKGLCANDGASFETFDCPAEHFCQEGGCLEWVCTPEAAVCVENVAAVCNSFGSGFLTQDDCGELVCSEGTCLEEFCGDGQCAPEEDCASCQEDCGLCGNCPECGDLEVCDMALEACVAGSVEVPAGSFWRGCSVSPFGVCGGFEQPAHEVWLDAYRIDLTEVTAKQYGACVLSGECPELTDKDCTSSSEYMGTNYSDPDKQAHPVNCTTYEVAQTYCAWAGKRLCTEAEWEKGARGGCEFYDDCQAEGPVFPWGNDAPSCFTAQTAECGDPWDDIYTVAVGSFPDGRSPYAIYDMSGNVWEFVQDWYGSNYYCAGEAADVAEQSGWLECAPDASVPESVTNNPKGPSVGLFHRSVRGGSFANAAADATVFHRYWQKIGVEVSSQFGFRCCADL